MGRDRGPGISNRELKDIFDCNHRVAVGVNYLCISNRELKGVVSNRLVRRVFLSCISNRELKASETPWRWICSQARISNRELKGLKGLNPPAEGAQNLHLK